MTDYLLPWDDDACAVVDRVLATLEPKHTMLILAILLLDGPQHFGELRRTLGEVSAKSLSGRLRALEKAGLVSRTPETEGKVQRTLYEATPAAAGFYDVLCAMRDWGREHLARSPRTTGTGRRGLLVAPDLRQQRSETPAPVSR